MKHKLTIVVTAETQDEAIASLDKVKGFRNRLLDGLTASGDIRIKWETVEEAKPEPLERPGYGMDIGQ